ncbi:hypothetical protein ACFQ2Y_49300 [Streptomyces malaysiensis subsp. malaysiensis]
MSDRFANPDLTTFTRLDELGLEATGQRLEADRAVLACRVVEPDTTRRGDKYVTVISDLTGIREDTGSARLLDMVEGARRR